MQTSRTVAAAAAAAALLLAACGDDRHGPRDVSAVRQAQERDDTVTAVAPLAPDPHTRGDTDPYIFVTTGTVNAVDAAAGTVNVSHAGSMRADVEAGTDQFLAVNRDALTMIQPGQRIEFSFTRDHTGALVMTAISPTPPERTTVPGG
jgi:Cu/Ag efflux protein CusF